MPTHVEPVPFNGVESMISYHSFPRKAVGYPTYVTIDNHWYILSDGSYIFRIHLNIISNLMEGFAHASNKRAQITKFMGPINFSPNWMSNRVPIKVWNKLRINPKHQWCGP